MEELNLETAPVQSEAALQPNRATVTSEGELRVREVEAPVEEAPAPEILSDVPEVFRSRFKSAQELADYVSGLEKRPQLPTPKVGVDLSRIAPEKQAELNALVQESFGLDLTQAMDLVGQAQQVMSSQQRAKDEAVLKQEWGTDYDDILGAVSQKFNSLSPEQQAKYDDLEGARLLGAQVLVERGSNKRPIVPGATPPPSLRAGGANVAEAPKTYSRAAIRQLMRTNPKEYARIERDISAAYREGRVKA